jgi:NADPH-dependent curcumin reductase CurA
LLSTLDALFPDWMDRIVMQNRSVVLRRRPRGAVRKEDFELVQSDVVFPPAGASDDGGDDSDDAVLIKNLYVSVDPAHRIWLSEGAVYVDPVPLDAAMRALTLGVIVRTSSPTSWPVGTHVVGSGGVQEYYVGGSSVGKPLFKVPDASTRYLSVCSIHIGLTAWHGVRKILGVGPQSVAVVSGAGGRSGRWSGSCARSPELPR